MEPDNNTQQSWFERLDSAWSAVQQARDTFLAYYNETGDNKAWDMQGELLQTLGGIGQIVEREERKEKEVD